MNAVRHFSESVRKASCEDLAAMLAMVRKEIQERAERSRNCESRTGRALPTFSETNHHLHAE